MAFKIRIFLQRKTALQEQKEAWDSILASKVIPEEIKAALEKNEFGDFITKVIPCIDPDVAEDKKGGFDKLKIRFLPEFHPV